MILSEDSIINTLNNTFNNNNSPEKISETHQDSNHKNKNKYKYLGRDPEGEHNYLRDQPEEKRWRYIREKENTLPEKRLPEEDFDSLTLIYEDDPGEDINNEQTCKQKEEINKTCKKKKKIKLNKKLIKRHGNVSR